MANQPDRVNRLILGELPEIQTENPNWVTTRLWAENKLRELRKERETPGLELRKMDSLLGAIRVLEDLLQLPDKIHKERKRDPIPAQSFGIANL